MVLMSYKLPNMQKCLRRLLVKTTCACIIIGSMPMMVFAEEVDGDIPVVETVNEEEISESETEKTIISEGTTVFIKWVLSSDGVLTISGQSNMDDFESLQAPWYDYREQITTIIIEEGVNCIGDYAFQSCSNLVNIEIPASVSSIGTCAFNGCNSLKNISISTEIKSIGEKAFSSCAALEGIWVEEGNSLYSSDEMGVLFNEDKTLLIQAPGKLTGKYVVPETITTIGEYAFAFCDELTELIIGNSVTTIDSSIIRGCSNLASVSLGDGLEKDYGIFQNSYLDSLTCIKFGSGITSISSDACINLTALKEIQVSEDNAIYCAIDGILYSKDKTKLLICPIRREGDFEVPESVLSIGMNAFYQCSALTNVLIPEGVTEIGTRAFYNCMGLTNIELPEGLARIESYAFQNNNNLLSINIPKSVTWIGSHAFENCSNLSDIALQGGENINEEAFKNCSSLCEITFPETLSLIDAAAFNDCASLQKITFLGGYPEFGIAEDAFNGVISTCYYPNNNLTWTVDTTLNYGGTLTWEAYEVNEFEGEENIYTVPDTNISLAYQVNEDNKIAKITLCNTDGTGILTIPEKIENYTVVAIGDYAFKNCIGLTEIVLPDTVDDIGEGAFYSCSGLTKVVLPKELTCIGHYTFYSCSALTDMEFPDALKEIGDYAFKSTKLTSVILPEGLTTVGTGVFEGSNVTSAVLPESLTYIPDSMFNSCHYLKNVDFQDSLVSIGKASFADCYPLNSVVLPEGLISIGDAAFACCGAYKLYSGYYECRNFTSITLPSTLQSIGEGAFRWCNCLKNVVLPAGISYIGDMAFAYCNSLGTVTFKWNAPEFGGEDVFLQVTATGYYPQNNSEWTDVLNMNFDGNITWVGQDMEEPEDGTGGGNGSGTGEESGEDGGTTGDTNSGETEGGTTEGGETEEGETEGGSSGESGSGTDNENGSESGGDGVGEGSGGNGEYDFLITVQPTNQNVKVGESAFFSVEAEGAGLTYQWQYSNNGGTYWYNSGMEGNTTASLKVVATTKRDGQLYRCIIKDEYGNQRTSEAAELKIDTGSITIATQPENQKVSVGEYAIFALDAEGEELTYQWQYSINGSYWFDSGMEGNTTNTLTVEALAKRDGQLYRCVITDLEGNQCISNVVTLNILTESIEIILQPEDQSVLLGEEAIFTVEAEGTGLTYQWQYSSNSGTYWFDSSMDGNDTSSLHVEAIEKRDGQMYRCVITAEDGSQVISNSGTLNIVDNGIVITIQPENQTVVTGESAMFLVEAEGTELTYQWQYSNNGGIYWYNSSMVGSLTNELSVNAISKRNGQMYRCVIKDSLGNKVITEAVILTVK